MASTYDHEASINEIEGESEEEEDEIETSEPLHHARRPMNAFLIFCKRQRAVVKERFPQLENRAVTKILGEWWANLEEDEKSSYTNLARQYREAFLKANPGFKWYKLPAPPLRPISNRLKLLTGLSSHQGSITPGKLADESQLGGLSSLLVPYNNMSVSPSLAVSVPKPPKKRYLEENASSDDLNQVFDDSQEKAVTVEVKAFSSNLENEPYSGRVLEIEPFAKLRNYSVSSKENIAQVKIEPEPNNMSVKSNGSLEISSVGNQLVITNSNNSFPYNFDSSISKVKCEEITKVSDGNKPLNNFDASSCSAGLNDGDCTEVKWKTKFEKIKSRHLNYNNNNVDESSDSLKCSSYECNSNQDIVTNKLVNGKSKDSSKDSSLNNSIKNEDIFENGNQKDWKESYDKSDNNANLSNFTGQSGASSNVLPARGSSTASKLNCKSDIVFYHTNKLPDDKTANKLLTKSVPLTSHESDANYMRRNKSVRACKGVRYQEFMSSNQLGRKRRRKNVPEGNEDEDLLNRHLLKIGSDEFKSIKDEGKFETMEVESAIYNIHDDLDQNVFTFNEVPSTNATITKSTQAKRVKHFKSAKRRRSVTSVKSNSIEYISDDMDTDKKCSSTNFNLEEKIEALPALSLEEFQEKKRAKNKKSCLFENNCKQESTSDQHFTGVECQVYSQRENSFSFSNPEDTKPPNCEYSSSSITFDQFEPDSARSLLKLSETNIVNGFISNLESISEIAMKSENNDESFVSSLNSSSSSTVSNSSISSIGTNSDQKSSTSSVPNNILVGSRKRKARRQKITHLEPGSKKKDTSVVEVDVLNDMGLATLAEVAALSRKENIS